jgi:hypothetical protein
MGGAVGAAWLGLTSGLGSDTGNAGPSPTPPSPCAMTSGDERTTWWRRRAEQDDEDRRRVEAYERFVAPNVRWMQNQMLALRAERSARERRIHAECLYWTWPAPQRSLYAQAHGWTSHGWLAVAFWS